MSKERFSKLKYKIFGLKEPVLEKYPELLRFKAIAQAHGMSAINEILLYIIYLYDPNTDLNQECPELKDRKVEACSLAGLKKKDFDQFQELNPEYTALIRCFLCEIYHNREHREWHTTLQEIDDFTTMRWDKVTANTDPKHRKQLSDLCDSLNEKADRLEEKMFGDHDDLKEVVIADRWSSPEKFSAPTLKVQDA